MPRLIDEIRRRKVGRVTLAYAAAAFVVLQVADIALPPLGAPDWVLAALVLLAAVGFPAAIALAWAFDVTPQGITRTPARAGAPLRARTLDARAWLLVAAGAVLSLGAGASYAWWRYVPDPALDADMVAVMPFRVSGDPSLAYLREGMMDLLSTNIAGPGGLRVADPRSVLSAWNRLASGELADLPPDPAKRVARSVGAGRMLLGSVVGTPGEITITASLTRVGGGGRRVEATDRGQADEIAVLIDRVTARLLSLEAGETEHRLVSLTSTSLPALRAYLTGQAAYRRSRFDDAAAAFDRALAIDSTFALAALGLHLSGGWGGPPTPNLPRADRLAWQQRHRLSDADRLLLEARIGPAWPRERTVAQTITDWERALAALPDRADAYFLYGDELLHTGALADRSDHQRQAVAVFNRSLALDSSFTPALTHLLDDAIVAHDTVSARRLFRLLERADTSRAAASYQYWARTAFFGDSLQQRRIVDSLGTMPLSELTWLTFNFYMRVSSLEITWQAVTIAVDRAVTATERSRALATAYALALNVGRPAEAARLAEQALALRVDELEWHTRLVLDGLFWDGDDALADRAAARLHVLLQDPTHPVEDRYRGSCALGMWHAWHGNADPAMAAARAVAAPRAETDAEASLFDRLCDLTIRSIVAQHTAPHEAAALLERADSIARLGPPAHTPTLRAVNFSIARLYELHGRPADALRATRRHVIDPSMQIQYSTFVRETGRLADQVGDRDAAIAAYGRYLHLRSDPDPSLRAQAEQVRTALLRLGGEPGR